MLHQQLAEPIGIPQGNTAQPIKLRLLPLQNLRKSVEPGTCSQKPMKRIIKTNEGRGILHRHGLFLRFQVGFDRIATAHPRRRKVVNRRDFQGFANKLRGADPARIQRRYEGSPAGPCLYQPKIPQLLQSSPDGGSAGPKRLRKLRLRQGLTGNQVHPNDGVEQDFEDLRTGGMGWIDRP